VADFLRDTGFLSLRSCALYAYPQSCTPD